MTMVSDREVSKDHHSNNDDDDIYVTLLLTAESI